METFNIRNRSGYKEQVILTGPAFGDLVRMGMKGPDDGFREVLSKIKSNIHIVSIDSDYYFTLERDIYTYNLIKSVKQNIYHHIIQSVHGHDGFLIENEKMSKILSKILIESKNGNNTRKSKQRLSI